MQAAIATAAGLNESQTAELTSLAAMQFNVFNLAYMLPDLNAAPVSEAERDEVMRYVKHTSDRKWPNHRNPFVNVIARMSRLLVSSQLGAV